MDTSSFKEKKKEKLIAGVDEAGRGPLAGPVVAAAVVLPSGFTNTEINDSKKLTAKKRDKLYEVIKAEALSWSIVAVGNRRIDSSDIRKASLLAMSLAVKRVQAEYVLIDGRDQIKTTLPQEAIIKGDQKFIMIAAASILAKVYRDRLMDVLNQRYPGYNLDQHAGYPTVKHRESIKTLGPSKIHRKSFKGVKEYLN